MKSIFDQATKVAEETQVIAEFGVTKQIAFGRGAVWAQDIYEEELNSWRDGSIIAKLAEAEAIIERVRALHGNGGSSQGRTDEGYGYIKNCCETCGEFGEYGVEWPCPTVAALDEEVEK